MRALLSRTSNHPSKQSHPEGLFVCLKCFNGFCSHHLAAHDATHSHPLYLKITAQLRPKQKQENITKLGIGVEGGASL